jgi:mono/diheme cytochrome c family protein
MGKTGDINRLLLAMFLPLLLLSPQQGNAMGMMDRHGGMMGRPSVRHVYYMRHGLPPSYARKKNPLPATAENLKAGKQLYEHNCVACHGATGRGDGPASEGLDPPPADLAGIGSMPMMSDNYVYWAIAEGGRQFNSAMPAMKGALSDIEIWKLVLYVRGL